MIATAEARPFEVATHNGCITIQSHTGEHRTVQIRTQPADSTFKPGARIVSLLVGGDNEHDYQGFGEVLEDGTVRLWYRFRDNAFHKWMAKFLAAPERYADKVQVNFEGRCRKCNRKLTTPASVASGIGPTCSGRE